MRFDDFNELMKKSVKLIDHEGNMIDAVPVNDIRQRFRETRYELKHGEWTIKQFNDDKKIYFKCSECDCYFEVDFDYCPSCGANMFERMDSEWLLND